MTRPKKRKKISRADAIARASRGRCWYCGKPLKVSERTRDHVIPKSRGGPTTIANLVLACAPCNTRKANLSLEEYRQLVNPGQKFYGERINDPPPSWWDLMEDRIT